MKTSVSIYHESHRKNPWLVCWWGFPDDNTGKQKKHTKSFRYRRDAQDFRGEKQAELSVNGLPSPRKNATLRELIEQFEKARLSGLSYSSKVRYADTIAQLREHFGNGTLLTSITQQGAETFMATRKRRDGRSGSLSSWTKAQHLKHSRAMFGAAVDWGYITANPFVPRDRRRSSAKSPLRIRGRSRPWHHITPNEFSRLLRATPSVRRRTMYWLMYGCGLRPGEVYNLRTENIDLDGRRLHIENRQGTVDLPPFTVKADEASEETKQRSIPIPEAAMPDLTAAIRIALKSGGFISMTEQRFRFVQTNWRLCRAGQPWGRAKKCHPWQNRDMVNNALRDAKSDLRRSEIELTAPFTLATFRKSFAQNHANNGTSPKTLAKLLGHSNERMCLRYYSQVTDANERAAAQVMDDLLSPEFHWSSTGRGSDAVIG